MQVHAYDDYEEVVGTDEELDLGHLALIVTIPFHA